MTDAGTYRLTTDNRVLVHHPTGDVFAVGDTERVDIRRAVPQVGYDNELYGLAVAFARSHGLVLAYRWQHHSVNVTTGGLQDFESVVFAAPGLEYGDDDFPPVREVPDHL